jgi:MOSC domain-containing protein YiiM
MMASIKSIVYRPDDEDKRPAQGYLRRSLQEARLIAGYGIEHDRKGGNPKRNLNVMDEDTKATLASEGYPTEPGALGENITLSGIDLRALSPGMQLQLGDEAVIVLVKMRTGCDQLHTVDARFPDEGQGRIGWMCRVERSGEVRVGDAASVLAETVEV